MSKAPSSTSQGSLKDDLAKIKSRLLHFDMDKAFGPRIGKTRKDRVQYGQATGQSVSDAITEVLKIEDWSLDWDWWHQKS